MSASAADSSDEAVLGNKHNIGINGIGDDFLHRVDHLVGQSAEVFLCEVLCDVRE